MSAVKELVKTQVRNNSLICLGLDLDPKRMPQELARTTKGMFDFAQRMIRATQDKVCAYKPNLAFFESLGPEGLSLLAQIIRRVPEGIPVILDGKRGDIGNTAAHYAEALFKRLGATWVTLNPYMGYDSMRPFLEYKDRGAFVLCLTSNSGSRDFQMLRSEGRPLYEHVAEKVAYWNKEGNCGLVVGATQPEQLRDIRRIADDMPLLIPGVGAQGGSLEKAVLYGTDDFSKPAVINVSRSVLYASRDDDFADRARQELSKLNDQVATLRKGSGRKAAEEPDGQKGEAEPAAPSPSGQPQGFTPPVGETPAPGSPPQESPSPQPPAPASGADEGEGPARSDGAGAPEGERDRPQESQRDPGQPSGGETPSGPEGEGPGSPDGGGPPANEGDREQAVQGDQPQGPEGNRSGFSS